MIEFKTIASGSSGNCYIVSNGTHKLMIECGIPIKKIREKGGFCVHEIDGCLISHGH